jgi:hypothetical protein
MSLRDVVLKKNKNDARYQVHDNITRAVTVAVDYDNSPEVDNRPGFVWIVDWGHSSSPYQIFNTAVPLVVDLPVYVGVPLGSADDKRVILGADWSIIPYTTGYSGNSAHKNHAILHEWKDGDVGQDPISTYMRSLVPLRVQIYEDYTVYVSPIIYGHGGGYRAFVGKYINLVSYKPGSGNIVRVLIYLNPDENDVYIKASNIVTTSETPRYIGAPPGMLLSGYIKISGDSTSLSEADIDDVRPFVTTPSISYNSLALLLHMQDVEATYHTVSSGIIP